MASEAIQVLFVEDNPADVRFIQELLAESNEPAFEMESVKRVQDAVDLLEKNHYDVTLLDWLLPDSEGVESFAKIWEKSPQMPIVVLTRVQEESVVNQSLGMGAQDYLLKNKITPELLAHSLHIAVTRRRLLNTELDSLSHVRGEQAAPRTSAAYGVQPLEQALPDVFEELIAAYGQALNLVLEERAYKVEYEITEKLRAIAERLGLVRATPRDVVDIHTTTLKKLTEGAALQKVEALVKEGRWTLIQVMGYLTSFYRNHCLGAAAPPKGPIDPS